MKLTEALQIIQKAPRSASKFQVLLACGYTPLHLQTFLTAELQKRLPERQVDVNTGLYGDLIGTVAKLENGFQAGAIALEWADLDPRLGFRQLGGWNPQDLADVTQNAGSRLDWLRQSLERIPRSTPVALSLPTVPLPPLFFTSSWNADAYEIQLQQRILDFAAFAASRDNLHLLSSESLHKRSAFRTRFDLKTDLNAGLPYSLVHAAVLGEGLASLIAPSAPKKGLITDLDDTLWQGIVGEIGHDNVCWNLDRHAQLHGLYQQLLQALAEQGVLVGVASKNDPAIVSQTFERQDLLIKKDRIFPFEVHWNRKSESIGRILSTWNIGADSVVFIDDSPMELDEVKQAYPDVECILFPKNDYAAAYDLFFELRDKFAKNRLSEEDSLRLQSIRTSATIRGSASSGSLDEFLREARATVTAEFGDDDPRVLELVNKTNQFNLNGIRYTEPEWAEALARTGAFVVSVSYEDKYGSLGKIAILTGVVKQNSVDVDTWVMSCRAFSRRIEYQCLKILSDELGVSAFTFNLKETAKNSPIREFLSELLGGNPVLTREDFENKCPPLHHEVKVLQWTTSNIA